MIALFRAVIERVKALFITTAALDLEADFVAHHAERRAELLRQADHYEEEGLLGIANHLRRQVAELDLQRPLAGVLPSIAHLQDRSQDEDPKPPRLRLIGGDPPQPAHAPAPQPRKRGAKP